MAHVAVVEGAFNDTLTIVCNIYAPQRGDTSQLSFYKEIFEVIEQFEIDYIQREPDIVVMGDLNICLQCCQILKYDLADRTVANFINDKITGLNLTNSWDGNEGIVTYQKTGTNIRSQIDYVLSRFGSLNTLLSIKMSKSNSDWTFVDSDHALVKCNLTIELFNSGAGRSVTLNANLLNEQKSKVAIMEEFERMMNDCPDHWSSGKKLEFAKVAIRSSILNVKAQMKNDERSKLKDINKRLTELININLYLVPINVAMNVKAEITHLMDSRDLILKLEGERLAEKARAKWFDEKSTKYFLNLLRKRRAETTITKLNTPMGTITEGSEVDMEIDRFYNALYNKDFKSNNEIINGDMPRASTEEQDKLIAPLTSNIK